MSKSSFRQMLSISGLLKEVRHSFERIPDTKSNCTIPLTDHLMSGLAIFGLKYPSLLQFDTALNKNIIRANLQSLYGIKQSPCDTYLRERLDEVEPTYLRRSYSQLFSVLQRGKGLEGFSYIDDHYLLSIDGTGYFSSSEVHCDQCCEKHHRDGHITYYHQLLGAVLVHPDHREVFPLAPEPILKQDGSSKNDCERNAAKRLQKNMKSDYAAYDKQYRFLFVEDALYANAAHVEMLQDNAYAYILNVKPNSHKTLFAQLKGRRQRKQKIFRSWWNI